MGTQDFIYRVSFEVAPIEDDPRLDFYFYSLSAIFEQFTPKQIGCRVAHLWNIGVSKGHVYRSRATQVEIRREPVARKHHQQAAAE